MSETATRALCPEEELAALLNDPVPTDWRDPEAVAGRQSHLMGIAYVAGEAAQDAVLAAAAANTRGESIPTTDPLVQRLGTLVWEIYDGLRTYVHDTQRGDGRELIREGLEMSAGATIGALVDGVLDRVIEGERERGIRQLTEGA
jgi:hypothetical protein